MRAAHHDTVPRPLVGREQGSYGRGIYAGHSTHDHDYTTPGSYGRGVYARQTTDHVDFRSRASYARGISQAGAD
jgi:hypothetical protein